MEEATRENEELLSKLRPPRPEDACLEDCALPPQFIYEAFLKAAAATAAPNTTDSDESDHGCSVDPQPPLELRSDSLLGIAPEPGPPVPCADTKGAGLPEVAGVEVAAEAKETADEVVAAVVEGLESGEKSDKCKP